MASAVPIEVVDWAYQETPPLYACLSCKRVGEAKVIEDHVLAQHHEGPPPFQCAPCKRKFSRELKARSHVTKNHSGKTFKEVIVKKPEVNILASGARPLSEGEAKSHLQDQIAKKLLKFPLKRKAERASHQSQQSQDQRPWWKRRLQPPRSRRAQRLSPSFCPLHHKLTEHCLQHTLKASRLKKRLKNLLRVSFKIFRDGGRDFWPTGCSSRFGTTAFKQNY